MTDYEYIYQQMKKAHYSGWDDEELRKCVDMLPTLSRDEQLAMYRSKWIGTEKTLKDAIFNQLRADWRKRQEDKSDVSG